MLEKKFSQSTESSLLSFALLSIPFSYVSHFFTLEGNSFPECAQ